MAEHDGICRNPECPAHRVGFDHVHQEGAPARMTVSTAAPASALEPTRLGEFVEVVVRVPIDRDGDPEAVWGYPDDWSGEQIARQIGDAYHSLAGYLADAIDTPGTKVAFRLRSKGRDGDDVLFVDKAIENPWGGGVGDAGEG